jgi:hypothetical protein
MTGTKRTCGIAALFGLALTALPANASSFGVSAEAFRQGAAQSRLVHKIHGCHYSCACGPPKELACEQWNHRHLHMLCLPVRCERDTDCERARPDHACRRASP